MKPFENNILKKLIVNILGITQILKIKKKY